MITSIMIWFIFGAIVGAVTSLVLYKGDKNITASIVLGIIGALIGGALGQILVSGEQAMGLFPLFLSCVGALALIGLYRNISPKN